MSTIDSISGVGTTDQVEYPQNTGVDKADDENNNDNAFAELLEEAMRELTNSAIDNITSAPNSGIPAGSGITGMPDYFLPMPNLNNTLEQAIQTAASSGKNSDAMLALLMLMMMMESGMSLGGGSGGSESMMMMQLMATTLDQFQDKDTLRNEFMYSSGGSPYILDTIDTQVFRNKIPEVSGTDKAILPLEWWRPTTPAIVSTPNNRNPALYRAVIDQFDVENAERYRPGREGNTYCNIYVWDVTRAMGAELPYYSDPVTGAPVEYPDTKGASVNLAVKMDAWLKKYGPQYGWRQATAEEAQMHANMGKPAMTAAGDVGHVQIVAPSKNGGYDPIKGVAIAQAGSRVSNYMYISELYGASTLANKVTYWVHE